MRKNKYLVKKGKSNELIKLLVKELGVPKVSFNFALYSELDKNIFEIKFINEVCTLSKHSMVSQFNEPPDEIFSHNPSIKFENYNVKNIFRLLKSLNISNAIFGDMIVQLDFFDSNTKRYTFKQNTLVGDIIYSYDVKDNISFISDLLDREISPKEINNIVNAKNKSEPIFDDDGNLNPKIVAYANVFGIDLGCFENSSLKLKLSYKSNDYTLYENCFTSIFGNFNNLKSFEVISKYSNPVSIVIPYFNSENTILLVLDAIESQKLPVEVKEQIQVIIVDDCSVIPAQNIIRNHVSEYTFKIDTIRLESNKGISYARNIGAISSIHEKLIFIDSDILLSENYISLVSVLMHMFSNCVYVSMKKNIEPSDNILKHMTKGLEKPVVFDDARLAKYFDDDYTSPNGFSSQNFIEILSDTVSLKLFGNGRIINGYDLPAAVIGHNICISKKSFLKAGMFSTLFKGWGMEDTFFGACAISKGCFVIPLLSTGVYHINHPERRNTQKQEAKANIKRYELLINEPQY